MMARAYGVDETQIRRPIDVILNTASHLLTLSWLVILAVFDYSLSLNACGPKLFSYSVHNWQQNVMKLWFSELE